ncbi:hypothetical protein ABZ652_17305 [Micromonospora chalcea]|uniref:hypothetical protein n=1 Tax=Micromonospora chalcea TaxID=1874 RepID=UPI0033FED40A
MSNGENEEILIEALRAEVAALRVSAESLLFSFDRVMNFALVFVIGGIGIALTKDHILVIAFVPFPVVLIVGYLLGLNAEGLSRAGHKRALEERLNDLVGPVFVEESHVAPMRQGGHWFGRLSVAMLQWLMGLMILGLFVIGFGVLWEHGREFWPLYAAGFVYSLTALGAAVFELSVAYQRAYQAAKSSFRELKAPSSGQLHQRKPPVANSSKSFLPLRWRGFRS